MFTESFFATFMVMFREALEASLIIGIILTVLSRMNQKKYFRHVIASTCIAIVLSIAAGLLLTTLTSNTQDYMETLIEGGISILACAVLTHMIFWMNEQAKKIKPEIESKIEEAVVQKELVVIVSLPFLAVLREGAETVLFLSALSARDPQGVSILGIIFGLALAISIVLAVFVGGTKIPMRPLFQYSGVLLLIIAAGLLAYGIHELQEIHIIPAIVYPVWNINHILNEKEGVGLFLKALFGYNGNPSLIEVSCYGLYLAFIFSRLNKSGFFSPHLLKSTV